MKSFWIMIKCNAKFILTILFIQLFFALFSLGLAGLDSVDYGWQFILASLFLVGIFAIIYAMCKSFAYQQFNQLMNNNARRKIGEEVSLERYHKEYRPYKGYILTSIIVFPLIIYAIVVLATKSNLTNTQAAYGLVNILFFGCYIIPLTLIFNGITGSAITIVLIIPVLFLYVAIGFAYQFTGIKMKRGFEQIIDSRVKDENNKR